MIYSEKLREIREEMNITQRKMSLILNLNIDVYGQYEREYYIMPLKHLIEVCNYFNVSLDYIFGFSKTKQYKNIGKNIDKGIVGKRLKEFRKENKLTQSELANTLNTTQAVIANYERERNYIATPFLYTICKKYHISADYLLGRIQNPKYY